MEHLKVSFDHVVNNLGPHGLPLIGRADWNDCLNLNCFSTDPNESFQTTENKSEGSKAESLMIAGQFVIYGRDYAELNRFIGDVKEAERAEREVEKMTDAIKHLQSKHARFLTNWRTRRKRFSWSVIFYNKNDFTDFFALFLAILLYLHP